MTLKEIEPLWETAPSEALIDVETGPSQEDWDWYFENTYVDPAERVF